MIETIELSVSGMKCGGCESNVSNKLMAMDGVQNVQASSSAKQVIVSFDNDKISVLDIEDVITSAGFTVDE